MQFVEGTGKAEGRFLSVPSGNSPICKIEDETFNTVKNMVKKVYLYARELSQLEQTSDCSTSKSVTAARLVGKLDSLQLENRPNAAADADPVTRDMSRMLAKFRSVLAAAHVQAQQTAIELSYDPKVSETDHKRTCEQGLMKLSTICNKYRQQKTVPSDCLDYQYLVDHKFCDAAWARGGRFKERMGIKTFIKSRGAGQDGCETWQQCDGNPACVDFDAVELWAHDFRNKIATSQVELQQIEGMNDCSKGKVSRLSNLVLHLDFMQTNIQNDKLLDGKTTKTTDALKVSVSCSWLLSMQCYLRNIVFEGKQVDSCA